MRTKTLILTAALGAVSIATSVAQTVYSVNAVGYVNVTLVPGFNMVANPLVAETNTVKALFDACPKGTYIYKYDPAVGYVPNQKNAITGNWGAPNMSVLPGEGVFIKIPSTTNVTITFVGEVMQGSLSNAIPAGFSIISSQVPQEGTLDALAFPKEKKDVVYLWNASGTPQTGYVPYTVNAITGNWTPNVPSVKVAEAFFVKKNSAVSWSRNFNVNQ